jgi:hypothetical protein
MKNAKSTTRPRVNPYTKGTALAQAYERGWQRGRREREVLEDHILEDLGNVGEVVDALRVRYQVQIAETARRARG